jgi:hypothetical protein
MVPLSASLPTPRTAIRALATAKQCHAPVSIDPDHLGFKGFAVIKKEGGAAMGYRRAANT